MYASSKTWFLHQCFLTLTMDLFHFSHKGKDLTKGTPRQANGKALKGTQCVLASTLLPTKLSLCLHVALGMKCQC